MIDPADAYLDGIFGLVIDGLPDGATKTILHQIRSVAGLVDSAYSLITLAKNLADGITNSFQVIGTNKTAAELGTILQQRTVQDLQNGVYQLANEVSIKFLSGRLSDGTTLRSALVRAFFSTLRFVTGAENMLATLAYPPTQLFNLYLRKVGALGYQSSSYLIEPIDPPDRALATGTGLISGIVRVNGSPVAGAEVSLLSRGSFVSSASQVTGSGGAFVFSGCPDGEYLLYARKDGYASLVTSVMVPPGIQDLDMTALPAADLRIETADVVVSSGNPSPILIYNRGTSGSISWQIVGLPAWCTPSPASGSLAPGAFAQVFFQSSATGEISADASFSWSAGAGTRQTAFQVIHLTPTELQRMNTDLAAGVETIAFGSTVQYPMGITIRGSDLYWTVYKGGTAAGILKRCHSDGGPSSIVAYLNNPSGQSYPLTLAVDDSDVWVGDSRDYAGTGVVWRIGRAAGSLPAVVATGQHAIMSILSDGQFVFWHDNGGGSGAVPGQLNGGGALRRLTIGSQATTTLGESVRQAGIHGVALDSSFVYWADDWGGIRKVAKGGGAVTTILPGGPGSNHPEQLGLDSTYVYWSGGSASGDVLHRVSKAGGADTPLLSGAQVLLNPVAAGQLYWYQLVDSTSVYTMPTAGGQPSILATFPQDAVGTGSVIRDKGYVYWILNFPNRIVRKKG